MNQLFTIPSDGNFLIVVIAFFAVSLFHTRKRAKTAGFQLGVEIGLSAVEEALELDQEAQDDLYEKMGKNIMTRLKVEIEEE